MRVCLAFDIGTTSVKGCAFDEGFRRIASVNEEYNLIFPGASGWIEMNPEDYWNAVCRAARELLYAGISPDDVASITYTTQGETLIPVDRDGRALANAVVWMDSRAQEEADMLAGAIDQEEFYHHTGVPEISAAVPLAKLMWFARHRPEIHANTCKYLLLEDWLILKTAGVFATEHSLLSSTGYFDIHTHRYWKEALEIAGISIEKLPDVRRCGSIVGSLTEEAALETGLPSGIPVVAGAMDQICAAIGAGNVRSGIIVENTGTCLAVTATSDAPAFDPRGSVQVYTHYDHRYMLMAYNPTAAAVLKWFKDAFCGDYKSQVSGGGSVYDRMTESAAEIPAGSEGLMLLPHFSGRLFPDADSHMRGAFAGIWLGATRAHFIRAILESVAYMLRQSVEVMRDLGIEASALRSVGGASVSDLWNGIKSTVTGLPTCAMAESESTALGAAILGAVGVGSFESVEDVCARFVQPKKTYCPNGEELKVYEAGYQRYLELNRRLTGFERNSG